MGQIICVVVTLSKISPSEFYSEFKNNPEEAKRIAFKLGQDAGAMLKSKNNIRGDDLQAVADMLNAFMRISMVGRAKVEENRVVIFNTGLCFVMRAAMTLGIPWEWLDNNLAWPVLEGVVSAVRPDMRMRMQLAMSRGDKTCLHVFEIRSEEK